MSCDAEHHCMAKLGDYSADDWSTQVVIRNGSREPVVVSRAHAPGSPAEVAVQSLAPYRVKTVHAWAGQELRVRSADETRRLLESIVVQDVECGEQQVQLQPPPPPPPEPPADGAAADTEA